MPINDALVLRQIQLDIRPGRPPVNIPYFFASCNAPENIVKAHPRMQLRCKNTEKFAFNIAREDVPEGEKT